MSNDLPSRRSAFIEQSRNNYGSLLRTTAITGKRCCVLADSMTSMSKPASQITSDYGNRSMKAISANVWAYNVTHAGFACIMHNTMRMDVTLDLSKVVLVTLNPCCSSTEPVP